jgi:hypothetical protein
MEGREQLGILSNFETQQANSTRFPNLEIIVLAEPWPTPPPMSQAEEGDIFRGGRPCHLCLFTWASWFSDLSKSGLEQWCRNHLEGLCNRLSDAGGLQSKAFSNAADAVGQRLALGEPVEPSPRVQGSRIHMLPSPRPTCLACLTGLQDMEDLGL